MDKDNHLHNTLLSLRLKGNMLNGNPMEAVAINLCSLCTNPVNMPITPLDNKIVTVRSGKYSGEQLKLKEQFYNDFIAL